MPLLAPGLVPGEDAVPVGADHAHEPLDLPQPGSDRTPTPAGQVGLGQLGWLAIEVVEVPPPSVGAGGGQLRGGPGQPRQRLGLSLVEPLGPFEPQVLAAGQLGGGAPLDLAYLVYRGVELGDDVVAVEGDLGVGQLIVDTADEQVGDSPESNEWLVC